MIMTITTEEMKCWDASSIARQEFSNVLGTKQC